MPSSAAKYPADTNTAWTQPRAGSNDPQRHADKTPTPGQEGLARGKDISMFNVHGVHSAKTLGTVQKAGKATEPATSVTATRQRDVIEISRAAKLAAQVQQTPAVRTELVARVKAEIAAGTFETPERIEATVDRMMQDLFGEA
jgi:negative regulator of flagellin synthesis FlgM